MTAVNDEIQKYPCQNSLLPFSHMLWAAGSLPRYLSPPQGQQVSQVLRNLDQRALNKHHVQSLHRREYLDAAPEGMTVRHEIIASYKSQESRGNGIKGELKPIEVRLE